MDKIRRINDMYEELLNKNIIRPESKIKEYYKNFSDRFSPEVLKTLSKEELLTTIFEMSNTDSLVYWLEFKNDEEYEHRIFGSIAGGSSYKYGLFNKKNSGWIYGTSSKKSKQISQEEACDVALQKVELLLKGAQIIDEISDTTDESYNNLQSRLEAEIPELVGLGWVHKYYHMIYPDKIDTYHNTDFHKYYIGKMIENNEVVNVEEKMYSMAAPIIRFVNKGNISLANCLQIGYFAFGGKQIYWDISEDSIEDSKEIYLSQSIFGFNDESIDLNTIKSSQFKDFKDELLRIYGDMNLYRIRNLYRIIHSMTKGDNIIITNNNIPKYIGTVVGDYEYKESDFLNHRRNVDWIKVEGVDSLKINCKTRSALIPQVVELQSIINIEKLKNKITRTNVIDSHQKQINIHDELNDIQKKIKGILKRKGQIILYGPPGTGKSYWAEETCRELASIKLFNKSYAYSNEREREEILGNDEKTSLISMCTFHPSYGYEDFIEGIKPKVVDGKTLFELRSGIFKKICKEAQKHHTRDYYLIIDEINRGDISRIFGELITVLESTKRDKEIILPLSGEKFKVPKNVYVIGTMNTTDKSISYLDIALRRRFGFIELMPDLSLLKDSNIEGLNLALWLNEINSNIIKYLGSESRNMQIGHSYLMENGSAIQDIEKLSCIIREDILPLVEEYCYGDYNTLQKIMGTGLVNVNNQGFENNIVEYQVSKEDYIAALKSVNPEVFSEVEYLTEDDSDE